MADGESNVSEAFLSVGGGESRELAPGVEVRAYVSAELGVSELTSGTATLQPQTGLPYHTHPTSELIMIVAGQAVILVEGRRYQLQPCDAIYIPAEVAHAAQNESDQATVLHTVFPTGTPDREFVDDTFDVRDCDASAAEDPESLVVFDQAPVFDLGGAGDVCKLTTGLVSEQELVAQLVGIQSGGALDLVSEERDQSVTLVGGHVVCEAGEGRFELTGFCDTVCVRAGQSHRLENSGSERAAVIISSSHHPEAS